MGRTIAQKRKKFMSNLIGTFDRLDPSGQNSQYYKNFFEQMSDDEFDKYVRDFFESEDENYYWEIEEYGTNDINLINIQNAADFLEIPLFEYVYSPYQSDDPDIIPVTPEPVPVGYAHIKRLQQTVMGKNKGSTSIEKRDSKTGQVVGHDKNAKNTDIETYGLLALGAYKALNELMGPRADDMVAKNQMYNSIAKNGYVSLGDLTSEPENKTALNTLDTYFLLQGFKTNLIYNGNILPSPKRKK